MERRLEAARRRMTAAHCSPLIIDEERYMNNCPLYGINDIGKAASPFQLFRNRVRNIYPLVVDCSGRPRYVSGAAGRQKSGKPLFGGAACLPLIIHC
jgi:hypothetical protein